MEVLYEENSSTSISGFDLLKGLNFNIEMCKGYPTMNAYVKKYEGTGYYKSSAWIQIITDKYYSDLYDENPCKVISEVDVDSTMYKLGVPFFAYGYPAEIYDAPCNNLGNYKKLQWVADTFFVTQPSRVNDNTIAYLLGFRWGYEEWNFQGERHVKILPIKILNQSMWQHHLQTLKDQFEEWKFR